MVPVLSNTTALIEWSISSDSALFMRIPDDAPRPVPTMMAVGVASPSAQGHEMTSTEMAIDSANSKLSPARSHAAADTIAIAMTIGTKTPLTLSASFAIGAFEDVASSTSFMIRCSAVSSPTPSTRILMYPELSTVAPVTLSPSALSTGIDSPVIADSSTAPDPSITEPSAGIDMPALTTAVSPFTSSSEGISISFPSLMTTAVFGARFISFVIASEVLPFALASIVLPRVISVRIMPADSK